jgi:hypothetical protein
MISRIRSVLAINETDINFCINDALKESESVKIVSKQINTITLHRKSSNKNSTLKDSPCVLGYVEYKGDINPYINILKAAELLNIGSKTSMGLGKIEVEIL